MLRRIGKLLLVVGAAVVVILALLPILATRPGARGVVERTASRLTGFDVRVEDLRAGYTSMQAVGVTLRAGEAEPFFTAENVRLTVRPHLGFPGFTVRAETRAPHLYVDRLPTSASAAPPRPNEKPRDRTGLPPVDVEVRGGIVHQTDRSFGPIDIDLASDAVTGTPRLSGTLALAAPGNELKWDGELHVEERRMPLTANATIADISALLRLLGWEPTQPIAGKAELNIQGDVGWDVAGGARATAELTISNLEARDQGLTRAVQAFKASGSAELTVEPGKPMRAKLDLSSGGGEVLVDELYVDLGRHRMQLHVVARRDGSNVRIDNAAASLANIGNVEGNGLYDSSGAHRGEVRLEAPDLSSVFQIGVQEPFGKMHPWLTETKVAGSLRARFAFAAGSPNTIAGRVEISDARADGPSLHADGIAAEVPFLLGANPRPRRDEGFVRIGEIALGEIRAGGMRLDLVAEPETLSLVRPVQAAMLGGDVTLERFSATNLSGPQRSASLGLSLREIALENVSRSLGGPRFTGTLSGAIPEITVAGGDIRSNGVIEAKAFDGTVRIRNLRIDEALSSVPEVALDAAFEDISLGRLTQELDVGKISGIARGAVDGLVVADWQPVRFDAWMESVSRSGVKQTIGVTALRQLSILGGSQSDAFSRGVLGLFDEYGYAKMGFRCRLRNDRFVIQGVQSEDGKEYLVVGSTLPPRVNVVAESQVISFSEMVGRLRRAFEIGSSGKPEVERNGQ